MIDASIWNTTYSRMHITTCMHITQDGIHIILLINHTTFHSYQDKYWIIDSLIVYLKYVLWGPQTSWSLCSFFLGVNQSGPRTSLTSNHRFYKTLERLHGPWCKQPPISCFKGQCASHKSTNLSKCRQHLCRTWCLAYTKKRVSFFSSIVAPFPMRHAISTSKANGHSTK